MRLCCIKANRSHYSVFVQKRGEEHTFLCVHIDLPDNKYGAKDIRFYVFILLRFVKLIVDIEAFSKPPFLCVHIDQMRFQKSSVFVDIHRFQKSSVFVDIHF